MSRITKRPGRDPEPVDERADQELVEDTMQDAPIESAADQTIIESTMDAPSEDRAVRARKRTPRERR